MVSQLSGTAVRTPDLAVLGLFLALSLATLARRVLGLPRPVAIYLPYFWTFFLAFALSTVAPVQLWVWVFAVLSFLALREYFTLVDLRIQDRWGILAAYLTVPFLYWYVQSDWYGMFIISVPVYAFLMIPFAVALGRGEPRGAVLSVGIIDLGLFLLVYCVGHVAYLSHHGTWMGVHLVLAVAICDLLAFLLGSRDKSPLHAVLLQTLAPAPLLILLGLALAPWAGIPTAHLVVLGILIPALVTVACFTVDHLEADLGIDRNRLAPGRGEILNSLKSYLYAAPVVFHYLRYFTDVF